MKKSIVLLALLVISSVIIFAAPQTHRNALINSFVLEKTPFEISGVVKEVVIGLRGFGYALLVTEDAEVKVPVAGQLITLLKSGTKVTVKGTKVTAFIPVSLEAVSYKLVIRRNVPEDLEKLEILAKIKKIEIARNYADVILIDEKGKEYRIPANFIPFWKNLKEGTEVKITGVKRTFELRESITIDGKTYLLPSKEAMNRIATLKTPGNATLYMKALGCRR
ncbi:hypothetical protein [Fervidobacterium sp.]